MTRPPSNRGSESYEIGFGKPPSSSRFKPGQSGNPRGRPKGSRTIQSMLNEILRQKVPVTDSGKTKRVPVIEVMFRRLANDAMRGDPRAIKFILSLADSYGDSASASIDAGALGAEDQAILAQYVANLSDAKPRHSARENSGEQPENNLSDGGSDGD